MREVYKDDHNQKDDNNITLRLGADQLSRRSGTIIK